MFSHMLMYVCSYLTYYVSRYKGGRTTLRHVVSQPDRKSKIGLDKFMEVANTFKMSHQPPFYYKWLSHKVSDKIVFLKKNAIEINTLLRTTMSTQRLIVEPAMRRLSYRCAIILWKFVSYILTASIFIVDNLRRCTSD